MPMSPGLAMGLGAGMAGVGTLAGAYNQVQQQQQLRQQQIQQIWNDHSLSMEEKLSRIQALSSQATVPGGTGAAAGTGQPPTAPGQQPGQPPQAQGPMAGLVNGAGGLNKAITSLLGQPNPSASNFGGTLDMSTAMSPDNINV